MENDSIRANGTDTLVDIWVEGKLRAICVTRAAIETFSGFDGKSGSTESSRCEFVRTHLPQIVAGAKAILRDTDPMTNEINIDSGHLGGSTDRRQNERRKTERRKLKLPADKLPLGERRRGDRRTSERRRTPKKKPD